MIEADDRGFITGISNERKYDGALFRGKCLVSNGTGIKLLFVPKTTINIGQRAFAVAISKIGSKPPVISKYLYKL